MYGSKTGGGSRPAVKVPPYSGGSATPVEVLTMSSWLRYKHKLKYGQWHCYCT